MSLFVRVQNWIAEERGQVPLWAIIIVGVAVVAACAVIVWNGIDISEDK